MPGIRSRWPGAMPSWPKALPSRASSAVGMKGSLRKAWLTVPRMLHCSVQAASTGGFGPSTLMCDGPAQGAENGLTALRRVSSWTPIAVIRRRARDRGQNFPADGSGIKQHLSKYSSCDGASPACIFHSSTASVRVGQQARVYPASGQISGITSTVTAPTIMFIGTPILTKSRNRYPPAL